MESFCFHVVHQARQEYWNWFPFRGVTREAFFYLRRSSMSTEFFKTPFLSLLIFQLIDNLLLLFYETPYLHKSMGRVPTVQWVEGNSDERFIEEIFRIA